VPSQPSEAAALIQRLRLCGRLPAPSTDGASDDVAALRTYLGDYQGALRACSDSGLQAALAELVAALPAAERRSMAFVPRRVQRRPEPMLVAEGAAKVEHGVIRARDGVELGYVYMAPSEHAAEPSSPPGILVRWGGNAELAAAEPSSPFSGFVASGSFHAIFVDYRGYGWSTGQPSLTSLHDDAAAFFEALPRLLREHGALAWPPFGPLVLMGRSIGSLCALGTAVQHPEHVSALVLDSSVACHWPYEQVCGSLWRGLAQHLPPLKAACRQLSCNCCLSASATTQGDRALVCLDPVDLASCLSIPLLVIAGTADSLCPRATIQALFDAAKSEDKQLFWLDGLGHNEVAGSRTYWHKLFAFLEMLQHGDPQNSRGPSACNDREENGGSFFAWCKKRSRT